MGMQVDSLFETFVERRSTDLLRTAYLLTGDRGHAEDLLQTALLRTAQHWPRARAAPEAYARRVLVNLSRDRIRRLFRRPRETSMTPGADNLPAADGGYDQLTDRRLIVRALATLPTRQREVIVLRFFEDLSVDQTADLLGFSAGTVKSYTSRALIRLRELLADSTATTSIGGS
ncbi:RNA polymerase sigma-70 factor, sigma-E family [Micromonospora echinaurantiaca]|uniref:RNA polymerase sigma-70 factor, sigma-E family n=1 Tax=Micromonospora echinaurantiaca TaxID=47857 RepID=A0A1C5IJI4_9ACTN|nr:SigE family RNA polymerase sigma factor [Micromonospora echinaurantiaca]SCG57936.1 RNA polymerase sigma-70 factor, sigma-E family [Micromonospora echinaurantiaca]